jgi:hypothetical protein
VSQRARRLFPNDRERNTQLVNFYYSAGIELINQKQFERAAALANEGLKIFPNSESLLKLKGYVTQ